MKFDWLEVIYEELLFLGGRGGIAGVLLGGGLIEHGVGFGLDSRSSYFGMEFHKHFYINIRPSLDHTALQTSSRGSLQLGQVLL